MPNDPYTNPEYSPFEGNFPWVPTNGFRSPTCERGKFRNDIPTGTELVDGSIIAETNCTVITSLPTGTIVKGDKNLPFATAFRTVAKPSLNVKYIPDDLSNYLEITTDNDKAFSYEIELKTVSSISAVTIFYQLSYHSEDNDARNELAQSPTADNYPLVQILGYPEKGDSIEYPTVNDSDTSELQTTYEQGVLKDRKATIVFGSHNSYPRIKKIVFKNRLNIKRVTLKIYKIMLFSFTSSQKNVNYKPDQLPCKMLQYRYPIDFVYRPSQTGGIFFPSTSKEPNLHIKMYYPEDRFGSIGFAHSMNLRFMIFSLPDYSLSSATTGATLIGLLETMANPTAYQTTFVGPANGSMDLEYALIPKPANGNVDTIMKRVILLDKYKIKGGTKSITLYKAKNYQSATAPTSGVEWEELVTYAVNKIPSSFLYVENTKNNEWYRVEQNGTTKYTTPAYKNQLYTEKIPITALTNGTPVVDTVTRRVNLLPTKTITNDYLKKATPFAVFISKDQDYIINPVTVGKGEWRLRMSAKSIDENNLVDTYIYARYWFQPQDEDLDVDNLYKYRKKTEIYFKYDEDAQKSKLVQGTPTSMDELFVSSALTKENVDIDIVRYVDDATSVDFDFSGGRLVVALYSISFPSDGTTGLSQTMVNLPQFETYMDGQTWKIETTLNQTLSSPFNLVRNNKYTSASYTKIGNLCITKSRVSNADLAPIEGETYAAYSSHFTSATGGQEIDNAFKKLLVLNTYQGDAIVDANLYIPYTQVSNKNDNSVFVYADFCTYSSTLANGRILNSDTWDIDIEFDDQPIQNNKISEKFKIEAFLVSTTGIVIGRVFTSDFIKKDTIGKITYSATIDTSFMIGNFDSQLIIRLYSYPYSKNGESVDISSVNTELNKMEGKPSVGLRIKNLSFTNTLEKLNVTQTDSLMGSVAFYEHLDLRPSRALAGQDFYFVADPSIVGKTFITFIDIDLHIMGDLYSPVWYTDLPEGMEAVVGGSTSFFGSESIWLRTIPSASKDTSQLTTTTALQNHISGVVTVVSDDTPKEGEIVEDGNQVVRENTLFTPGSFSSNEQLAKDHNGKTITGFNSNSSFVNLHMRDKNNRGTMSIISEKIGNSSNEVNAIFDSNGSTANYTLDPLNSTPQGTISLAKDLSFPLVLQPKYGSMVHVIGWRKPGILLCKNLNIWNSSTTDESDGEYYIIDGEQNLILDDTYIRPDSNLNGNVIANYPSAVYLQNGKILVAYGIEGRSGVLYGRISSGAQFGSTIELLSIPKVTKLYSSVLDIIGPVMAYDQKLGILYIAFYCSGKVFGTYLAGISNGTVTLNPWQLIAGSSDFTLSDNSGNIIFNEMYSSSSILINRLGAQENDVFAQRVGFLVSKTGRLYVYYKYNDNKIKAREINMAGVSDAIYI